MSSNACVGCSLFPSPALMNGTWRPVSFRYSSSASAACFALPGSGWRMTTTSWSYPATMSVLSRIDSPFTSDENWNPSAVETPAPKLRIAPSKLKRVRVDGS